MTDISLNEYDLEGDPTRYEAEDRDHFVVDNDRKAAWAVRKLGIYRARLEQAEEIAREEIGRIGEWLEQQVARDAHDIAYFEGLLTQYALQQRAEQDRKSIDTPYGIVKTRAGQPKFAVTDAQAFLEWARTSHPDFIRVKEEADLTLLKATCSLEDTPTLGLVAVTDDGEVVPGLQVTPGQVSVKVEAVK